MISSTGGAATPAARPDEREDTDDRTLSKRSPSAATGYASLDTRCASPSPCVEALRSELILLQTGLKPMRLVVVSNRLPFTLVRDPAGGWTSEPGSGGLVTALRPVLQNRGGCWIGWTGATAEELPNAAEILEDSSGRFGYELVPLTLTEKERDDFYYGFSNEVVWPLFHDLLSRCRFEPRYWQAYESVNRMFAEATAEKASADDFVWVHDYHLMAVAGNLHALGLRSRIGFFLHIPFPPLDLFLKLPWRFHILRALIEYDLLGFQTARDRGNFLQCVRHLLRGAEIIGKGAVVSVRLHGREIRVGTFPISIDFRQFESRAGEDDVLDKAANLRRDESGRRIVLGVDRLDYTKGIPEKLEAFRTMLMRFPAMRGNVTLIQVVVPSREEIPGYQSQKLTIEGLVGRINGEFTRSGWVPIHYIYRSLEGPRLPAYYLAADVALVTPLKDGMNLVAKEYCATRADERGALVLSEFAGAAAQLQRGAFLVNPFDVEGVASSLEHACRLTQEEQRGRMRRLRRAVKDYDIYRWVDEFLEAAISRDLADFPRGEEYIPESVVT